MSNLPLSQHTDFLIQLADELGKDSNFLHPFPKITEALLREKAETYNNTHPYNRVNLDSIHKDYELLRHAYTKDKWPLFQQNSDRVSVKDIIEHVLQERPEELSPYQTDHTV
jgi:hypothetical protein